MPSYEPEHALDVLCAAKRATRYEFGNTPELPPLTDGGWNDDLVRAAGFDPDDDEVWCRALEKDWGGHHAGADVVGSLTLPGWEFVVFDSDEEE